MKRRTLEHLRPKRHPEQHHNVYVALLNASVSKTERLVPRTRSLRELAEARQEAWHRDDTSSWQSAYTNLA
jgi:hypothetical protein